MQESQSLKFAGDVNIQKVKIITSKGVYQDISPQVINIQYYEDMFSPFITGSIIVKDSFDLVNILPFVGEEFVELEISTPSLDPSKCIKGRYYIYKLTNRELVGDRAVVYQLHFISEEGIVDLNKQVSRAFSGKISDLVKPLLEDKGYGLESKKKSYIEVTQNAIKYISNYWSPIKNIFYLVEQAQNDKGIPNFVFFENRDGFYFMSMDSLYKADTYQDFVYDSYLRDDLKQAGSVRNTQKDFKRIIEISIPEGFDYMERIRSGAISSRQISYDVTKKTYSSKLYNMFQNFEKQNHLNTYPINSDKAIFKANSRIINFAKDYGQFDGFGDITNSKSNQERISLIKIAQANKINITVPGRADYTVGQKVNVTLNKVEPISAKDGDIRDKMFSGNYLIAAINHYVDRDKHECHMELIKDSLMIDLNGTK